MTTPPKRIVTHIGAQAEGERPVKREALTVAQDLRTEVAAQENARAFRLVEILEAASKAEVVGGSTVTIEALECEAHAFAGIRQRHAELMVVEGPVRRFEDRRAGLLRGSGAA